LFFLLLPSQSNLRWRDFLHERDFIELVKKPNPTKKSVGQFKPLDKYNTRIEHTTGQFSRYFDSSTGNPSRRYGSTLLYRTTNRFRQINSGIFRSALRKNWAYGTAVQDRADVHPPKSAK